MQSIWLNKNGNKKLIIFFNGWSMDSYPFTGFENQNYDVLMFYDHQNLDTDYFKNCIPDGYSETILIGWSMGVWVGQYFRQHINNLNLSIAINGTLEPIHDEFGIPVGIFDATLKNFTLEHREKFYKRMFSSPQNFKKFLEVQPEREFSNQRNELEYLKDFMDKQKLNLDKTYDKAIISTRDKIFPGKNMHAFWKTTSAQILTVDSGHFPFFLWAGWEDLIDYVSNKQTAS